MIGHRILETMETTSSEGANPSEPANGAKSPTFNPFQLPRTKRYFNDPDALIGPGRARPVELMRSPVHRSVFFMTIPGRNSQRECSRAKGNRRSTSQYGLPIWESRPLDTLESVRDALSELFNAGAKGDITASRLSAISNSISKAIEGSEIDERIKALEERTEAKK